eukprot:TRINITY_DN15941_c0_g4_i9.p2 TRINITY_DN15941_c0_g4~~TRINITY_DN15941_c0_g4_i9.p2  ORF type:complete len:166 (+),score=23.60 TRINITY_DN15941_c0_g4_i9:519-1016(+)
MGGYSHSNSHSKSSVGGSLDWSQPANRSQNFNRGGQNQGGWNNNSNNNNYNSSGNSGRGQWNTPNTNTNINMSSNMMGNDAANQYWGKPKPVGFDNTSGMSGQKNWSQPSGNQGGWSQGTGFESYTVPQDSQNWNESSWTGNQGWSGNNYNAYGGDGSSRRNQKW